MRSKRKIILPILPVAILFLILAVYIHSHNVPVIQPTGEIGLKERNLILLCLLLSSIVVIPVFALTIFISLKYRAGNKKAKYRPDFDHSVILETIWWAIPICIISVLSVVTWNSSHSLDPYRALDSKVQPIPIEVVALDWKWLFIYPLQGVASVNRVEFPVNTPVDFYITSDTVMNSFWIPSLGGQIYAMPGMQTQLHLLADKTGVYYGSSANISGTGFAGMNFSAYAVSNAGFKVWMDNLKTYPVHLTTEEYGKLAQPSQNAPVSYYSNATKGLFQDIISKYMMPTTKPKSIGPQKNAMGMN